MLPGPGDEAAGAQSRAVLIPTACAHAQTQNTCTDQQSLERESPEVFTHQLFFHTLEGSEDLLDSGEAWTDIHKHHIKCRHFELKLEAGTWKAIPGLCGCSSALHRGTESETQPPTPQPLPPAPCSSSHLLSSTFPVIAVPCGLPPPQVLSGLFSMSLIILHP